MVILRIRFSLVVVRYEYKNPNFQKLSRYAGHVAPLLWRLCDSLLHPNRLSTRNDCKSTYASPSSCFVKNNIHICYVSVNLVSFLKTYRPNLSIILLYFSIKSYRRTNLENFIFPKRTIN